MDPKKSTMLWVKMAVSRMALCCRGDEFLKTTELLRAMNAAGRKL